LIVSFRRAALQGFQAEAHRTACLHEVSLYHHNPSDRRAARGKADRPIHPLAQAHRRLALQTPAALFPDGASTVPPLPVVRSIVRRSGLLRRAGRRGRAAKSSRILSACSVLLWSMIPPYRRERSNQSFGIQPEFTICASTGDVIPFLFTNRQVLLAISYWRRGGTLEEWTETGGRDLPGLWVGEEAEKTGARIRWGDPAGA
jgi:hypothetical protein